MTPILDRPNLVVRSWSLVTSLLWEGDRVAGVRYRRQGEQGAVRAAREVIVCAGAIGSPQLLMLSGIGPAAHLWDMGIKVNHDLTGVGQSLQDHASVIVSFA